ncbi:conserved protein of unknown function [Limnospira indica PCC 8005]|uniref:Uncharacterized protein n=1 Tax=Limnospira indica PCC 8005 TaxID=376219 RepID=A0A9P1KKQ6_9CYAN|nr:conserved protein of unknown function [Limnospira indica PCC 8005]
MVFCYKGKRSPFVQSAASQRQAADHWQPEGVGTASGDNSGELARIRFSGLS